MLRFDTRLVVVRGDARASAPGGAAGRVLLTDGSGARSRLANGLLFRRWTRHGSGDLMRTLMLAASALLAALPIVPPQARAQSTDRSQSGTPGGRDTIPDA